MNNPLNAFKGISRPIWLLAIINFINRCGAMIMCFLSLYITSGLGYDIVYAGYAMSVYGLGAIAGQQIGGYLTDKIGYRIVQLLSLVTTGLIILILMHTKNFYALCVVLFCLNMVSEAFRPANSVAVSSNSSAELRTRSFSLLRVSFNLAIMIALTLGGWLISQGWFYIFWADALTCFASAIALMLLMPSKDLINKSLAPIHNTTATNTDNIIAPNSTEALPTAGQHAPLSPYKDSTYMRFIAATFLNALAFMQIVWTVPQFFKEVYGWNEFTIGCVSAINGCIVMLVEMPFVHRIESRYASIRLIRYGCIIYAISYLTLTAPLPYKWVAAVMYMVFISFGEMLVMPFSIAWATRRAHKEKEGKYISVYGMSYSTANVIAPLIGTQIIHHLGYTTLWCSIACVAISSLFILNRKLKM